MTGFGVMLDKELREAWRTRRLPVVAIVYLAFGIVSPLLARLLPEIIGTLSQQQGVTIEVPPPTTADAVAQFVRNIGQTGVLVAIGLAMGSVATEKERGTAAMWLTRPLGRGAFLAAKVTAIIAVLAVSTAAAGIAGYAYTGYLFEGPSALGWAAMCGLLLLQVTAYAAITFVGSTLMRSSLPAAAVGIAALAIVAVIGALPVIGAWTPSGLADAGLAIASGSEPAHLWQPVVATVMLVAIALGVAWASFRRAEL